MKTLSVRQPWAWLIVNGFKTVENRSWTTRHRGPLAIHAGLKIEKDVIQDLVAQCEQDGEPITPEALREMHVTGAVIGVVDVIDCTRTPTEQQDIAWHEPDAWAWILRNPRVIEPVAQKGRLGLFDTEIE